MADDSENTIFKNASEDISAVFGSPDEPKADDAASQAASSTQTAAVKSQEAQPEPASISASAQDETASNVTNARAETVSETPSASSRSKAEAEPEKVPAFGQEAQPTSAPESWQTPSAEPDGQGQSSQGPVYGATSRAGEPSSSASTAFGAGAPQAPTAGYYASSTPANTKTMNKHVFVWVMSFLLGGFGADRFVRGQIGWGVVKLLLGWLTMGVWWLIDWIIAMVKAYGSAFGGQDDLVFVDGKYAR